MNPLIQLKKTTRVFLVRSLLGAATASLLVFSSPAQAGYIITVQQVGPNVVATGSGALDPTGLDKLRFPFAAAPAIRPDFGVIVTGSSILTNQLADHYTGAITGPSSFGSGGFMLATTGTGDIVGIGGVQLLVPSGYVSGTALSSSATWNSATFASLGVTPGTYFWAWGTGLNQNQNQSLTLQLGPTVVPDAGSTIGLLILTLAALFVARRALPVQSA
jgi:protein with PEP-CTERM/exosortase system signal